MAGLFFVATALGGSPLLGQSPPACTGGKTALVLSGGGAKGLAHISVLRALDSLGARPDFIVGSSVGAVIGALYASGYDARAIEELTREVSATDVFGSAEPRSPRAWRPLRPLLTWEQGAAGLSIKSPGVNEPRVNGQLSALMLRGNLLARGDFDSLPIPFRAVSTNLATREVVVLTGGDLAQAVRASIAIPLVFPPEPLDSLVLTDGGLSANIPVGVARALGASRVIVSDVTGQLRPASSLTSPLEVAEQLVGFLFMQLSVSLLPGDLHVRVDVQGFRNLDFSSVAFDRLLVNGRRAADSVFARASCLPRAPLQDRPLPLAIADFTVDGGLRGDETLLERVLGIARDPRVDQPLLRSQLQHLTELDAYDALWLNPRGQGDSVSLRARVRRAAPRLAAVTVAYDNDLGGRLGLMYLDRHLLGTSFEGSATAALSRIETRLNFGLRRYFGFGRSRLVPAATVRLAEEKIIRYDANGQETGRPSTREAVFFAGLEREFPGHVVIAAGGDARFWRDADTTGLGERAEGRSGGFLVRISGEPGWLSLQGEAVVSGTFRRMAGRLSTTAHLGRLTLMPTLRAGWGERLPLQNRFPLGGDEGFPGVAVEELRGDRELFAGLQAAWLLKDPVSILLLVTGGRVANGGPLFEDEDWLSGVRAGLGLETAIGPVRFEYGVASNGRDQLFVRIGRWF